MCIAHRNAQSEILNLKWSQIRNDHIYLRKTKSNKKREIPINDDLADLFKRIRRKQHLTSDYIYTYQSFKIKTIRTAFNGALRRAGIKDCHFHGLRHTFASHFAMRAGDLKALQEILWHADIKTKMRYAHLAKSHMARGIR